MAQPPHVRASDADREQIAERLRQAATEGRLSAEELEERIHTALSAQTYGELDPLVSDLPAPPFLRSAPAVVEPRGTNGMAIASLVLGVLWLGGLGSLGALVLGLLARREIDRSEGRQTGRGLAIGGIVLGTLGLLGLIAMIASALIGLSYLHGDPGSYLTH